ncbi:bifunctional diguanylate cyclase/phosphodiesterase [Phyllobacterium endophyticum]|uniref:bifunctional diguanylate cyclase/phosphodiesterase n=1 Tax=Phyllobacterium endophyticum TaxID=1149773 RepID=UPI0011CAFE68|nr:EAL domain-containing protein [Phyllobacterium endophyticum]TXR50074.1 EAL domain-containing protein [Phyllobacterium endophyticum]
MLSVYNCIVNEHDFRLVLLAAAVCTLASFSAVNLLRHARRALHKRFWIGVAALACGFGIWATHFIAMLAFSPGLPHGYNIVLTSLSLIIAIAMTGLGTYFAIVNERANADLAGGATIGAGIAAMHFTGMAAFEVEGHMAWDSALVVTAVLAGILFAACAVRVALIKGSMANRLLATALLTLAICAHHFIAMGAASITPDSTIVVPAGTIASGPLALAIAMGSVVILSTSLTGIGIDIRGRRRAREMERMRKLVNAAVEGLVICDGETIVTANDSFAELIGMSSRSLVGLPLGTFLTDAVLGSKLRGDQNESFEAELIAASGVSISVELIARAVDFGETQHRAIAVRDLRSRKEAEAHISYLAHHDALTGLPNRRSFNTRLDQQVAAADINNGNYVALFCLDLDRFKEANDLFGHAAGDEILQSVARTISQLLGQNEMLARLGGDEFAIIVPGIVTPSAASRLAEQILDALHSENRNSRAGWMVSTSIGIAIFPIDGNDRETLLNHADQALYRAKAEGRNTFRFFEASMGVEAKSRRLIEQELRQALMRNELKMVYQPQMQIDTGEVTGFEALMRWHNARLGEFPPTSFIPIAEESGIILQLGEWALFVACQEAASWEKPLSVAVNVSAIQLYSHDFPQKVHSVLLRTGLAPYRLELEITETSLIKDTNRALAALRHLKSLGVRIAMDDFGTGYSSLSNVRAFPFDMIKIDRSFIKSVDKNAQGAAIVKAVLGLGRGLGLPVLAEGIETPDELEFLAGESCAAGQGFYLGQPGPIENFKHLISSTASFAGGMQSVDVIPETVRRQIPS